MENLGVNTQFYRDVIEEDRRVESAVAEAEAVSAEEPTAMEPAAVESAEPAASSSPPSRTIETGAVENEGKSGGAD